MTTPKKNLTFEKAYSRLEEILSKMNGSEIALEESLVLFEEADELIHLCNDKLKGAQTKIEKLLKDRNNHLVVNDNGVVEKTLFTTNDAAYR
ncbi:MAG: exodeoxyribonuclease VII small subunit [Simkaniaceae bacterium]|nr:exodeoxyribonuclease VII small subunit [Simkaniaceae bacterium]